MSGIRHRSGSHGGSDKDVHYRVVVLGAPGVGKSSITSINKTNNNLVPQTI